jgi:hypothetical protein
MAIDIFAKDLVLLDVLLDELPIRPTPKVITEWQKEGRNGSVLETIKYAGRVLTTRSEFRRFVEDSQRRWRAKGKNQRQKRTAEKAVEMPQEAVAVTA